MTPPLFLDQKVGKMGASKGYDATPLAGAFFQGVKGL
jgi:hypothetical protein